jgi:hypothetical protein
LSKSKIKKKERASFEKIALAANLDITFKKSKTDPGYFRILIAKDSTGLKKFRQRDRFDKIMIGFFRVSDTENDFESILNIIYGYLH